MCAIWRSDLEVQTDLENDVITSSFTARMCEIPRIDRVLTDWM
jgi:hypothetical protein